MRQLFGFLALGLMVPDAALAATIVFSTQSGRSEVRIAGATQQESSDTAIDGRVSVFAVTGTPTTPQARTAARSGPTEIAVNALIDDQLLFSVTDFVAESLATYRLDVMPNDFFAQDARVDFALPPAFLEIRTNAEIAFARLDALIDADLRFCLGESCDLADESLFRFHAALQGSWREYSTSIEAGGHASLDVSALQTPTVTDTGGFIRTTTVEFPSFLGHLDLGQIPAGVPAWVEYTLQARAFGIVGGSTAMAAINDPFLFSTDPVQSFAPLRLRLTEVGPAAPVPEPSTWLLCATAVAVWMRRRTRSA